MSKIELINGDCLEELTKLENNSVDLVLIDPPYNIGKDKWDKWKTVELYVDFLRKVFLELQRVLKDNGSFYFFHNDFMQIVEIQNMINKDTDLIFKSIITLIKESSYIKKLYSSQKHFRNYINNVEYCLFYTFQDETGLNKVLPLCFNPYLNYMTEQKELLKWNNKDFNNYLGYKSISSHWFWQNKEKTKQNQPRFISEKDYLKLQSTGYFKKEYEELRQEYEDLRKEYENQRYTFNFNEGVENCLNYNFKKHKKINHPTVKPDKLMEDLIKCSSNENHTVLDCFMGSGSTGVAAKNLNRNFIGIELDKEYFEIAKKRIQGE